VRPAARTLAAAALLGLSMPFSGLAQTSGALDPKAAGGATNLLVGAIQFMQKEGHPESCLSGMEAHVNQYTPNHPGDPTTIAGSINSFHYFFYSPVKPHRAVVSINEPIGAGPAPQQARYHEYDPYYVGELDSVMYDVRPTCISDFGVDTGRALAVAAENGLPLGTMTAYELLLVHAAGPDEPDWKDAKLRRKIFWTVKVWDRDLPKLREFLIDAQTGRFIKARTVKNPHFR
jgi:hypothetical protein